MRATESLRCEHRLIERALDCLQALTVAPMPRERGPDLPSARKLVEFLRVFVELGHQEKETQVLFPALEAAGFPPHAGPTTAMRRNQHEDREAFHHLWNALRDAEHSPQEGWDRFREVASELCSNMRDHIQQEDHRLFPMIETGLDAEADRELMRRFAEVELSSLGAGTQQRYGQMLKDLSRRLGLPLQV